MSYEEGWDAGRREVEESLRPAKLGSGAWLDGYKSAVRHAHFYDSDDAGVRMSYQDGWAAGRDVGIKKDKPAGRPHRDAWEYGFKQAKAAG